MASLDVESLFTNIPIDETIKNAVDDCFSSNMYRGKLSKSELYYLLKLATSESSFIFDKTLYKQIDGVAMGSPLGPTLANAFLCHYERLWLDSCPPKFKPVVYRRYVDDIFILFKSKDHLLLFATYMNTRHNNLKFTFHFEQNNSFSFLDVKITCGSNGFSTSVFVKPRLVEFSRTLIVLSLSLTKQVLFLHYCFVVLQFALICKVFIRSRTTAADF